MDNYIVLKFTGRPISKDNEKLISKYPSKKTRRHYMYTSTKYKAYEEDLRRQAQSQLPKTWKPLTGDVWVSLFFHFKNRVHTDICNLPKSICDAFQGGKGKKPILYKNDKQVWLDLIYPVYDKEKPEGFTLVCRAVHKEHATLLEKIRYINERGKEADGGNKKR